MKRLLIFIICAVILSGCSAQDKKKELNHEALLSGASMNVTSESLVSGRWSDAISNLPGGKNLSPQLSFSPVTEYAEGRKTDSEESSYIGPYPPKGSGEHVYTVYVFALNEDPDSGYPSEFDAPFIPAEELLQKHLDISGGKPGNVLEYGYLSGTFSND